MQTEEPYLGLTCRWYEPERARTASSDAEPAQVLHGCRQLVS